MKFKLQNHTILYHLNFLCKIVVIFKGILPKAHIDSILKRSLKFSLMQGSSHEVVKFFLLKAFNDSDLTIQYTKPKYIQIIDHGKRTLAL